MARGGRKSGTPNYKNGLLISIIKEKLPNGALQWQDVAEEYHKKSGELLMRNPDDIKKHWNNVLCNKCNKPMGRSGGITDRILHCIRIQGDIMKKTDSVMMGADSDDDVQYMYNGVNAEFDLSDEEEDDEEEDDRKPAAIDDTTIARLVEASTEAIPPLPPLLGATAGTAIASATAATTAMSVAATTATTPTTSGATATTATSGAAATATTAAATAATVGAATNRKKKLKPAVNEKTKNSSNVNHERGSIRKTMDRLADALITMPSLPTPAAINPILEQNVMSHLVSREVDRVMDVHRGYLRDLARRSRETGKMLKRLMKDSNDSKRKSKKQKKSASGAKEKEDGENNNNRDSDSDSSSNSSSSSSSSSYDE
jgi:hypothetical protein